MAWRYVTTGAFDDCCRIWKPAAKTESKLKHKGR